MDFDFCHLYGITRIECKLYRRNHRCHVDFSVDGTLTGKILKKDVLAINEKLNLLGIATFNEKNNLLDNTLRIANVYNRKLVNSYTITSLEELKLIIWILVKNKIYFEEIVILVMATLLVMWQWIGLL